MKKLFLSLLASSAFTGITGTATAQTPASDPEKHTNSLGMDFASIPGTTIMMARNEVRVADFEAFLKGSSYEWAYKPHFEQGSDHPITGVNLPDALAFCGWLTETERKAGKITEDQSYRLPTRQEWSAAAGLPSALEEESTGMPKPNELEIFPWGTEWPPPPGAGNLAQREIPGYNDDYNFTSPVGKFQPTPAGIYDLAGNVWEWTQERELRTRSEATLRGGSWAYFRKECLTSGYMYEVPADLRAPTFGIRCVFEDRRRNQRIRTLAAAKASEKEKAMQDELRRRRAETEAELAKMSRQKADQKNAPFSVDTSGIKPAIKGTVYTNSLGLVFSPVGDGKVSFCQTETTLLAIEAWAKTTGKPVPKQPHFVTDPKHPIVSITWTEAVAFCDWLTEFERTRNIIPATARYRLPTDQEWSQAAGLTNESGDSPATRHQANTEHFIGGKFPPEPLTANLDAPKIRGYDDRFNFAAPVGSMKADAGPLFDMGGNVSEWTADEWPDGNNEAVARGPSWITSDERSALTSARIHRPKDSSRYDIGFRCVLEFAN